MSQTSAGAFVPLSFRTANGKPATIVRHGASGAWAGSWTDHARSFEDAEEELKVSGAPIVSSPDLRRVQGNSLSGRVIYEISDSDDAELMNMTQADGGPSCGLGVSPDKQDSSGKRVYLTELYSFTDPDPDRKNVVLRCGVWWKPPNRTKNQGWGWCKLFSKNRWSEWYRGMISATIYSPGIVKRQQSSVIYLSRRFDYPQLSHPYRFKVLVDTVSVGSNRGMKGIITAYKMRVP